MRTRFSRVLAVVCLAAAVPLQAAIAVTLNGGRVVASGITPNGNAVFAGVIHGQRGHRPSTEYVLRVVAAGSDGTATLQTQQTTLNFSLWGVVDAGTGDSQFANGSGIALQTMQFAQSPLVTDPTTGTTSLNVPDHPLCEVTIVRPGNGTPATWGQIAADGGTGDADPVGGRIKLDLQTVEQPIQNANSTPIGALTSGDVIVLIDPTLMQIYRATVGAQ